MPGRLRQNWATEHNPGRTERRKIKDWPGNRGERERERDDRRRGGRGEAQIKSFFCELH